MANLKNLAADLVAVAPSPATTGTTLEVRPGAGSVFPATPFFATLTPQGNLSTPGTSEIIQVTDVTGDVLTIVRGQKSTTAKAIANGWVIANAIYSEDVRKRTVNNVAVDTTLASVVNCDYVYFATGTITLTLPTAVGNANKYSIQNTGTGVVTITTTGGQTINGETSQALYPYESVDIISNNTSWGVF